MCQFLDANIQLNFLYVPKFFWGVLDKHTQKNSSFKQHILWPVKTINQSHLVDCHLPLPNNNQVRFGNHLIESLCSSFFFFILVRMFFPWWHNQDDIFRFINANIFRCNRCGYHFYRFFSTILIFSVLIFYLNELLHHFLATGCLFFFFFFGQRQLWYYFSRFLVPSFILPIWEMFIIVISIFGFLLLLFQLGDFNLKRKMRLDVCRG